MCYPYIDQMGWHTDWTYAAQIVIMWLTSWTFEDTFIDKQVQWLEVGVEFDFRNSDK